MFKCACEVKNGQRVLDCVSPKSAAESLLSSLRISRAPAGALP